jgi:flavin reductase (DIM6/NTAB) family NADH-FMN oxidoreductase RutF
MRMSPKAILPVNNNLLRLLGFTPVTLITTLSKDGSVNAAPHGWVTVVDYDPPQLLFLVNTKHNTYRNVKETREFVVNIPGADMIREIWVTQKHFPSGTDKLKEAKLTVLPSEKVKPPRIMECKAHIECKVSWTRIIGSACLVLGSIEAISVDERIGKLDIREQAIALDRLMFFSYESKQEERKWMFAQIGKIQTLTEKGEQIQIRTEGI